MIVDAHLDLAYGALLGRDLTLDLATLRENDPLTDVATVTFETLRRGGVGLCLGTLFTQPRDEQNPWGYANWQGAREQARAQLEQYLRWQDEGHLVILTTGADVEAHARRWSPEGTPLGVVLLMEGADPMRDADDLPAWLADGVRVVGTSWVYRNRYAGGNMGPGGLTDRGRELLVAMRELGVPLDVSHMSDESFWEGVELQPKVLASHSNARAIVNTPRQMTDEMLAAVRDRGGMVGINLFSRFLVPGWERGHARPPFEVIGEMTQRVAQVVGWDRVGIGSDLDGGFGRQEIPDGLESAADLPRLGELVPDAHRDGFLGGNWVRWLTANL